MPVAPYSVGERWPTRARWAEAHQSAEATFAVAESMSTRRAETSAFGPDWSRTWSRRDRPDAPAAGFVARPARGARFGLGPLDPSCGTRTERSMHGREPARAPG